MKSVIAKDVRLESQSTGLLLSTSKSKEIAILSRINLIKHVCVQGVMMKQQDKERKQKRRRQTLGLLCSVSGLLLLVVCCMALIRVELRLQEHHRLISHSVTFYDKMETEIL